MCVCSSYYTFTESFGYALVVVRCQIDKAKNKELSFDSPPWLNTTMLLDLFESGGQMCDETVNVSFMGMGRWLIYILRNPQSVLYVPNNITLYVLQLEGYCVMSLGIVHIMYLPNLMGYEYFSLHFLKHSMWVWKKQEIDLLKYIYATNEALFCVKVKELCFLPSTLSLN